MLLRHHFDNLSKIPSVGCPILLVHGTEDDFVLPAMADALGASAKSSVGRLAIPGGNHRNVMQADEERLWGGIGAFEDLPELGRNRPMTGDADDSAQTHRAVRHCPKIGNRPPA